MKPFVDSFAKSKKAREYTNRSPTKSPRRKPNLQEFREIFRLVDTDESGDISREELFRLMKQVGLNPTMGQVNQLLKEIDVDEDGTIGFDAFVSVMSGSNTQSFSLEQILQAFRVFDTEDKGYITTEQMLAILTQYGDDTLSIEESKNLIASLDQDKKGIIHYKKYCEIHSSQF